jgi:Ca-activated chloride channel homolog
MTKRQGLFPAFFLAVFLGSAAFVKAQKPQPQMPVVHVRVDMVQLDVAVTNKKGYYVTGLAPSDFAIYEDDIRQKIATFGEANEPPRKLADFRPGEGSPQLAEPSSAKKRANRSAKILAGLTGANVFILFDTSNYMYRGFVFAQDSIAQFVRYLDRPDQIAFYSYSRDFSRVCQLSPDHALVASRIRYAVAGSDAALYDALLLTLKDAGKVSGPKVVVVFSNGPDDASVVAPEDVRELAQSEGVPIYMVSTRRAEVDPISAAIFDRISASTGGKAYFASGWHDQLKAFASIRDDLLHLYMLSYYPQPNPNLGWRKITVKLVAKKLRKYHVRTRSGYRPRVAQPATWTRAAEENGTASGNGPTTQ